MDKFETTVIYNIICQNKIDELQKLLSDESITADFRLLSKNAETYLHLALQRKCQLDIITELVPRVRLGQRDVNRKTAFDYVKDDQDQNSFLILKIHQDYIMRCIRDGNSLAVKELILDGWSHWPVKGIPEIEEFPEALGYLSGTEGSLRLINGSPGFFPKHLVKALSKEPEDDLLEYCNSKDILGMTPLHLAVLYRCEESMPVLLKCPLANEMLQSQDNMGRTPVHYAFSFSEGHLIREIIESAVLENKPLLDIVDKLGYTANDYKNKKLKLDTKKLIHLYTFLMRCLTNNYFVKSYLTDDSLNSDDKNILCGQDVDDPVFMKKMMYNCKDEPFIDASGRNYLHKAVILCQSEESPEIINTILQIDGNCGNKLYKGQDLWGRTPLHYAYMFNREAMNVLLKKKSTLSLQVINEVKRVQDYEGKTIDDYHMEEKDAKELKRDLANTLMLLTAFGMVAYTQQVIIDRVLKEHSGVKLNQDWYDFFSDLKSECGSDVLLLAMHSQTNTGVPLIHLVSALPNFNLIEAIDETYDPGVLDYMGRTIFHYLDKDTAPLKDALDSEITEENDVYQEVPNEKYYRFDLDFNEPDCDSDREDSAIGLYKKDLQGCTAFDYHEKKPSFAESTFIIDCLNDIINKKSLTTQITQKSPQITINKERTMGKVQSSSAARNRLPSTNKPRLSANQIGAKHPPPPADNGPPFDTDYLKKELGAILTAGLGTISLLQPTDPIEFLAQYLYKHSENIKHQAQKKEEERKLALEMEADRKENERKARLSEERKKIQEQNKARGNVPQFSDQIIVEEKED